MSQAIQVVDGWSSLADRYVPRVEVYFAKEPISDKPAPPPADKGPISIEEALAREKQRLDRNVFVASGDAGAQAPRIGQLLPLSGPWGEKQGQETNDMLSVEFTESIDKKQALSKVRIDVHNVFDFEANTYRYTDLLRKVSAPQSVFPLLDYGDTIAVRFGYGSRLDWVFEGIITTLEAAFPADGEPKLTVTAVDKRERMRCKKKLKKKQFSGMSEEQIAAEIAAEVGLSVAIAPDQKTPAVKEKGGKPADQDALQFLTDRANKAALELSCFGNTLFVLKPADAAKTAIAYTYRRGMLSFSPVLNNAGKPTAVRVVSRNPTTGEKVDVTVTPEDLQELGLMPQAEQGDSAVDDVKKKGQGGEKVDVVTNYLARTPAEAKQIAVGIMKRNLDQAITVSGDLIGDPRVRARTTLKVAGVGRFGGYYYVTEAVHKFGSNGYQTSFKARRNTALGAEPPKAEAKEAQA